MKDGDKIIVDAETRTIDWLVSEEVKIERRKEWEASGKNALNVRRGILYRYARDVAVSASQFRLSRLSENPCSILTPPIRCSPQTKALTVTKDLFGLSLRVTIKE